MAYRATEYYSTLNRNELSSYGKTYKKLKYKVQEVNLKTWYIVCFQLYDSLEKVKPGDSGYTGSCQELREGGRKRGRKRQWNSAWDRNEEDRMVMVIIRKGMREYGD